MMVTKRNLRSQLEAARLENYRLSSDLDKLRERLSDYPPLPPCKNQGCFGCRFAAVVYDVRRDTWRLLGCMKDQLCESFAPAPETVWHRAADMHLEGDERRGND